MGEASLREVSALAGGALIYLLLVRPLAGQPLSRVLLASVALVVLLGFVTGLGADPPRPPAPEEPAAGEVAAGEPSLPLLTQSPGAGPEPPPGPRVEVDSLLAAGEQAVRSSGILGGRGPVGRTVGAIGDVTAATAEILVRTVYSGSNVTREDTVLMASGGERSEAGIAERLLIFLSAIVALALLGCLRHLFLVERSKGTLARWRLMTGVLFLHVLWVSLGMENVLARSLSGLDEQLRTLLSVSPFYLLLVLASIVNGLRVKWMHYLKRWGKYLALGGAIVFMAASQLVLARFYTGGLTLSSSALGCIVGCVSTVAFFFGTLAAVSILLHLPSARMVDRRLAQLRVLEDLGRSAYETFDEDRIMTATVALGRKLTGADSCWAVRSGPEGFVPWKGSPEPGEVPDLGEDLHAEVLLRLAGNDTLLLSRYPGSELRSRSLRDAPVPGSLLAAPLRVRERTLGLLFASTRDQFGFMSEVRRLFGAFARQSAAAVENSRLLEAELERERLREELAIARSIQSSLLPEELPAPPGFRMSGRSRPSLQVGGDYFDAFPLPEGRCALAVADVAGKGAAASLLMAALQSGLHAVAPGMGSDAAAVVSRMNSLMLERMPEGKFITLFYGVLDPAAGRLHYCAAGHDPPLLLGRTGVRRLSEGGLVLGVMPDAPYDGGVAEMAEGDTLVLYTDGVTETMRAGSELCEYGVEALTASIAGCGKRSPEECIDRLFEELREFRGDGPVEDDMTVLVLRAGADRGGGSPDGEVEGGAEC